MAKNFNSVCKSDFAALLKSDINGGSHPVLNSDNVNEEIIQKVGYFYSIMGEAIQQQVVEWLRANKDMPEFNEATFSLEGKVFVPGIKGCFDIFKSLFGDSLNKVVNFYVKHSTSTKNRTLVKDSINAFINKRCSDDICKAVLVPAIGVLKNNTRYNWSVKDGALTIKCIA